jgi:hypothetical protein
MGRFCNATAVTQESAVHKGIDVGMVRLSVKWFSFHAYGQSAVSAVAPHARVQSQHAVLVNKMQGRCYCKAYMVVVRGTKKKCILQR